MIMLFCGYSLTKDCLDRGGGTASYVPDLRRKPGSVSDVTKYRDYNTPKPGWGGVGAGGNPIFK